MASDGSGTRTLALIAIILVICASAAYCSAEHAKCKSEGGHLVTRGTRDVCEPNPKTSTR